MAGWRAIGLDRRSGGSRSQRGAYNPPVFESDTSRHEDDHAYENMAEEEIPARGGSLRVAVWIVSAGIAIVMVVLPVMRVIDLRDRDDAVEVASSDAQSSVAARFAEAVVVQRSADVALRWARPDLRDEIDTMIVELNRRPPSDLAGAQGGVTRVACGPSYGRDRQCFNGWLRQPVATELFRMLIVVAIVNGDAVVVAIGRVNVVKDQSPVEPAGDVAGLNRSSRSMAGVASLALSGRGRT